jgi:glucose/arabinose dehydrogenase
MAWTPDGELWISERGGRISRVDLGARRATPVGELPVTERGESGLMGIAFHPDFPGTPWVYAAHSYAAGGGVRNRLVRMRYDGSRLEAPETLLDGLPGNANHDGSRLAVGPDRMLYMTTGDAGSAQLAQDRGSLAGKVLRLTLDGAPAPGNPFGTAVWSYGHRNPQGLVFRPGTDVLYASEHGPNSDDEVNVIERGRNYGWPTVRGFCDTADERAFCAANDVVEPVTTWTPTIGTAGADFYHGDVFPQWRGNLLVTSLRGESLFRIELGADGRRAATIERLLQGELGRIRDVLVGPDGALYLATSNRDGRGNPRAGDDRVVRLLP